MIADTGKDRIITGMIKVRITGMRQKIPEKAEVHDIKEEQIITGPKEETGRRDMEMGHVRIEHECESE